MYRDYKLKRNKAFTNSEYIDKLQRIIVSFDQNDSDELKKSVLKTKPPKAQKHGKHFTEIIEKASEANNYPFFMKSASVLKITPDKISEMLTESKKHIGDIPIQKP